MSINKVHSILAVISLCVLPAPAARSDWYNIPMPTKSELQAIQLEAYICSRENNAQSCERTRQLADPLMDHPRLPSICKDTVWQLLQSSKKAENNNYIRRDAIDLPARRIAVVCIKRIKPSSPAMMKNTSASRRQI